MTRRHADFRIPTPAPWTWIDTLLVGLVSANMSIIILAFFALFLLASPAHARWKPEYAHADLRVARWFAGQHNARGEWCCDESDGARYDGAYTIHRDGSVTLAMGRTLPAYMVLTGPNPTGHAVWWHMGDTDYCFAPGPMG
jgi:hypothetical protein